MALPIPDGYSFQEAAAIPEVFLTAYQALRWIAQMQKGENVLIHAGASGVGTAAIQLVKAWGGTAFATASAAKHDICLKLGAEKVIDYKKESFDQVLLEYTEQKGMDVVLDFIGAAYWASNLNVLATDGRMVLLAVMSGIKVEEANLLQILRKRLQISGSTLRARALSYKIKLSQGFCKDCGPLFQARKIHPVIDQTFSWRDVADAHRYMEANKKQREDRPGDRLR